MQLYGFAEQVFNGRRGTRGSGIGPLHELAFGHRLALVAVPRLLMVAHILGVCTPAHLLLEGRLYLNAVLQLRRIAESLEHALPQLGILLRPCLVARLLLGQHVSAVFPTGEAPYERRRQQDGEQEVFKSEKLAPVRKERIYVNLYSVTKRHAGSGEEQHHRLPYLELRPVLHLPAGDVDRKDKQEHRDAEMVGHHGRNHDVCEREEHR